MTEERKPPMSIEELQEQLVGLTEDELEDLMDRVAAERGMSPEVEQAWMDEVDRRIAEVDAGEAELIPIEVTIAKMRALLA